MSLYLIANDKTSYYFMERSRKGGFGQGGNGGGFKKSGGFGDRKPFSKPSFGGDYTKKPWDKGPKSFNNNDDREMFSATCSGCGKSCQVPFRPATGKPVFCDECFVKTRNSDGPSRDSRPAYGNDRGARPMQSSAPSANTDVLARQMQVISGKLDTLIELMSKNTPVAKQAPVDVIIPKREKTVDPGLKAAVKKALKPAPVKKEVKKVVAKKVAKTTKKK